MYGILRLYPVMYGILRLSSAMYGAEAVPIWKSRQDIGLYGAHSSFMPPYSPRFRHDIPHTPVLWRLRHRT